MTYNAHPSRGLALAQFPASCYNGEESLTCTIS